MARSHVGRSPQACKERWRHAGRHAPKIDRSHSFFADVKDRVTAGELLARLIRERPVPRRGGKGLEQEGFALGIDQLQPPPGTRPAVRDHVKPVALSSAGGTPHHRVPANIAWCDSDRRSSRQCAEKKVILAAQRRDCCGRLALGSRCGGARGACLVPSRSGVCTIRRTEAPIAEEPILHSCASSSLSL